MRVTQSDGMLVGGLNAASPVEVFDEYAESTGQSFDKQAPIPFFLHNTLGLETPTGHKIRVPLAVHDDGSVSCASDVPAGATVHIMKTSSEAGVEAASNATEAALRQLDGLRPQVALFFDCVATRLRMGGEFGHELEALQQALGPTRFVGCNTYGQIARADGQFSGFHNCTAVVCIIPE